MASDNQTTSLERVAMAYWNCPLAQARWLMDQTRGRYILPALKRVAAIIDKEADNA